MFFQSHDFVQPSDILLKFKVFPSKLPSAPIDDAVIVESGQVQKSSFYKPTLNAGFFHPK